MIKLEEPNVIANYTKVKVLGKGSFGEVSLWQHKGKYFAIKTCTANLKTLATGEANKLKERWLSEINMMKKEVKCESIVKTVNINQAVLDELAKYNLSGLPCLVMEYCENGDLRQMLCKIENSNGLKEYECKNVLKCLRNAVKTLHDMNITHRDIKPENIVIQNKDGINIYKLTDLGYAKQIFHTAEHSHVGSPGYFAPEIITSPEYSQRVDYWSIGIIAFEIICGIKPFIPHQTLVKWMLAIKGKSSKVIAITENNKKELLKHEKIFNENQITDMFKFLVENWLTLALEYDGKQRGSQFIQNNSKSNDTNIIEPPKLVLKFYSELDKVINTKILKLFSITSYRFLSYIINENTTMDELKRKIEISTSIPSAEIYFIIPIESKIDQIKINTKPIDFYIENSNDVMLYLTQINKICEKPSSPPISNVIQDVIEIRNNEKIESFYFKEFMRHLVYMLRKEQLNYVTLLNGLKNYALTLNDSIEKNQSNKEEMKNNTLIALTKVNSHIATVNFARKKMEEKGLLEVANKYLEKWERKCDKMQHETQKFVDAYLRVVHRFDSILRRSGKILNSTIFANLNDDHFNVKKYEEKYQLIRHLKDIDRIRDENKTFRDVVYEWLEKRKSLLKNIEFKDLQTTLSEIHIEYIKCHKILIDSQVYLSQYDNEIKQTINEYYDEFWELFDIIQSPITKLDSRNNNNNSEPNFDILLKNNKDFSLLQDFNMSLNKEESMPSCFGETNNIKNLIDENDQINGAFESLLTDLNQLLK